MAKLSANQIEFKRAAYAEFGILYKFENGSELIYCDPINEWIHPLMPKGSNKKLGNAHSFSIMHGNETFNIFEVHAKIRAVMEKFGIESVKASCPLHCDACYCDFGCFNFPDNKARNFLKLILARFHMGWTERALSGQTKADKAKQIRIHVAGDFFSADYSNMWARIARRFERVTFWAYTKVKSALAAFEGLKNVHVVPSITPVGFNFGTCAELLEMHAELTRRGFRVHICACGTPSEKHCASCHHGCKAIGDECDFVLFIKHSTPDYKAGVTDPKEYALVCELIAKQNN